jgi:hypothetical protein
MIYALVFTTALLVVYALLERIKPRWYPYAAISNLVGWFEVVTELAIDFGEIGPANFLYSDSELLFAHGHHRKQASDEFKPSGLYYAAVAIHCDAFRY